MEAFDAILDESARVDPTTKNILPQSLIESDARVKPHNS